MIYIFWISIIVLLYTYFGYPLYVVLKAKFVKNNIEKNTDYRPLASIIMSAYNEDAFIERKLNNLLESNYPKDKIEILVGSDGSTDHTDTLLMRMAGSTVKSFIFKERRGKPSVLNDLVGKAKGEILVFCDTRQIFDRDAMGHLAANLADERVGCVSGELIFDNNSNTNGISEGVGIYWDYEKLIRKSESAIHSMVGATGAIYAIRKDLYTHLPKDTILDDVYIPLSIARKGYRCIWEPLARAYDKPAFTPDEEYKRKVRTLAGNYQIFAMFKDLLIPLRNAVSAPLLSHKLLRVLAPFFMITLFVSNLSIAKIGIYGACLIFQILFYLLAIMGSATYKQRSKRMVIRLATTVYMFCLLNFTALAGLWRFVTGRQRIAWKN